SGLFVVPRRRRGSSQTHAAQHVQGLELGRNIHPSLARYWPAAAHFDAAGLGASETISPPRSFAKFFFRTAPAAWVRITRNQWVRPRFPPLLTPCRRVATGETGTKQAQSMRPRTLLPGSTQCGG